MVGLSVTLSIMWMYPAKTAGPIKMPFGMLARVDPSNHVLDGGQDPPEKGACSGMPVVGILNNMMGVLSNFFDLLYNLSSSS